MGNQLGAAPPQIFPVEHYFIAGTFESDLQYESRYFFLRCLEMHKIQILSFALIIN